MLGGIVWLSFMAQATVPGAVVPASIDCGEPDSSSRIWLDASVNSLGGKESRRIELPDLPDGGAVLQITEQGIDVSVELLDSRDRRLGRSASPIFRMGVATVYLSPRGPTPRALMVVGNEHLEHRGAVRVRVFSTHARCSDLLGKLAAADSRYADALAAIRAPQRQAREAARQVFKESAQIYEALATAPEAPVRQTAALQFALASIHYYDLSQWAESDEWAAKAAASASKVPDTYLRARAQAIQAAAWIELRGKSKDFKARLAESRQLLIELRDFHVARHEDYDAALQTNNIGLTYYYESRFEEALPYLADAATSFRRLSDPSRMATALQNTALCKWGLGDLPTALGLFGQARTLMDATAHPDLYLIIVNNQALTNYSSGKFDEALAIYEDAIEFAQKVQDDSNRARSYYGIGVTQYALGDRRLAAQFLNMALTIWTADLDSRGRASALRALAVLEQENKHYGDAIRLNLEAQSLVTSAAARARIQVKIATSHEALGERGEALEMLSPIIESPPDDNALVQAEARLERGRILLRANDLANAQRDLERALAVFRALQSLYGEFDSQVELARVQARAGREIDAMNTITAALAMTDELGAQTANPEYRASVVQTLRPAQELLVELLHAKYSRASSENRVGDARRLAAEALAFVDNTRAQTFDRIQAQRYERLGSDALQRLIRERDVLHRTIADRRYYLATREERAGTVDARARALRDDIARLRIELGNKNTSIARISSGAGNLERNGEIRPVDSSRLRATEAFIEYWIGADNAYAWVVRQKHIHWIELGEGSAISLAARHLHDSMRDFRSAPAEERVSAEMRVHRVAFAPLVPYLQNASELVIAADGLLHVTPFAALRASERDPFLVQRYSIAFVPSFRHMSWKKSVREVAQASGKALVVADPIYQRDDSRRPGNRPDTIAGKSSTRPASREAIDLQTLVRLPATSREATAVSSALHGLTVDLLVGPDASREALLAHDLASYRFIHIATHGVIDTDIPRQSALIMGAYDSRGHVADQLVRVDDLLTATFNAELVTLSACNTSLGAEFAGEGPIGLRYAALARGARSVVSSLWPVADETTADLMAEMYGSMTNNGYRADVALAMAMRRLLEKRPSLDAALWAPYTAHLAEQQTNKERRQ